MIKNYELYNSTLSIKDKFLHIPIGKKCRFCNKAYPEASFKNIPHIIPELFGRNNITSNFECDNCNREFQKFESSTSTMIQHYLAILNIKSKKGVPIFQSNKNRGDRSTVLKAIDNNISLNFDSNLNDFEYDEENKSLTIYFRTKNFSPFHVYKTFFKMGISLLSESDLLINEHYIDFLNLDCPVKNGGQFYFAWRYILKTKYFLVPVVNLYKAKQTLIDGVEFPEYGMTIFFSNVVFQIFLPISLKNDAEHNKKNELRFELFPSMLMEDVYRLTEVEMHHIDLSETNKISISDKIVLYYDKKTTS